MILEKELNETEERVLAYLRENPGSNTTEIAAGVGCSAAHMYGVLRRLRGTPVVFEDGRWMTTYRWGSQPYLYKVEVEKE